MDLADVIIRGTRAAQPSANAVAIGTLYYVTDERTTEFSNGSSWLTFSDSGTNASIINAGVALSNDGEDGEMGAPGRNGIDGINGRNGPPGYDGEDADPVWPILGQPGPIGPQGPAGTGGISLLHSGSGTSSAAGATNLDTFAITGLTALDTLLIEFALESGTGQITNPRLMNSTDTVEVARLFNGTVGGSDFCGGETEIKQLQSANTAIFATTVGCKNQTAITGEGRKSTYTTVWTGSWSLALSYLSLSAGTMTWNWSVYKLAGQ